MAKNMSLEPAKLQNVGDYIALSRNTNDERLVELWLDEKSDNTKEAYTRDITLFMQTIGKPIQAVMLDDLQDFGHSLVMAKQSSRARTRNAVKSLFSFAIKMGYIRMNPAVAWKTQKVPSNLAARILTEEQVFTMLAKEEDARNHALLRLIYNAGLRVSELCNLNWNDVQPNATTGGQVTVLGKGDKVRSVAISKETYTELIALRGAASAYSPVFVSREHGHLTRGQVFNIVSDAAVRAGIAVYLNDRGEERSSVSPHWLRHAHARPNASSSTYLHI